MYFWPKNDQNEQNKNFPRHNTAIRWFKELSPVSDQVLDKSDVRFRRKCPNTWFFSENGQILDQKRGPKMAQIFLSEQKFSLTIFKQ